MLTYEKQPHLGALKVFPAPLRRCTFMYKQYAQLQQKLQAENWMQLKRGAPIKCRICFRCLHLWQHYDTPTFSGEIVILARSGLIIETRTAISNRRVGSTCDLLPFAA